MKKPVKTALCLLLCALLSLPALAEVAAASKPLTDRAYATSGDYTYTLLEDGSARIIDYTGDAEALTVPAELGRPFGVPNRGTGLSPPASP